MISVNDFRTGLTIEVDGEIWRVLDFQHVKPGKGAAFVRSKLRNLRTGAIQEKTFRARKKWKKHRLITGECNIYMQVAIPMYLWIPKTMNKWSFRQNKSNMN